jgi:hypothetical protein
MVCNGISNERPIAGNGSPASFVTLCLDCCCGCGVVAVRSGAALKQAIKGQ